MVRSRIRDSDIYDFLILVTVDEREEWKILVQYMLEDVVFQALNHVRKKGRLYLTETIYFYFW